MDNSLDESYKQGLIYQRALRDSKPRWTTGDDTPSRLAESPNKGRQLKTFKNMLNTKVLDNASKQNSFLISDRETGLVEGFESGTKTLNELVRRGHSQQSLMQILHDPINGEPPLYDSPSFGSKWLKLDMLRERIDTSAKRDRDHIRIDGIKLSGLIIGDNAIFPNPRYLERPATEKDVKNYLDAAEK
jgi:hypothetical protein